MAQISTKQALDEAKAAAKQAENAYRKERQEHKKLLRDQKSNVIAADRARDKARQDLRLAKKAHQEEQDRIQIEKAGIK
jgi:outer membrane protein TolC